MEIPSVGDIICNEIRGRILNGEYSSGERLNVDELARKLNTSKTPVREALGRLESEGLASFKPRVGWSVNSMSMAEFVDFLEMQWAMRYFITENIMPYIDDIDFDLLRSVNKKMTSLMAGRMYFKVIQQNDLFHMTIFSAHPNRLMFRRLEELDAIVRLQRVRFFEREKEQFPVIGNDAYAQHLDILAALEKRDPGEIIRVSKEHHESILRAYRQMSRDERERSA
ncbi:MAG: GntR family transcriptional regulator [Synergistaceae bacterium]|jgi:DNA-binding GntR family transcriptional regulator|nr:GntR family transcriptional regulator [Synergistaceae bacterium]